MSDSTPPIAAPDVSASMALVPTPDGAPPTPAAIQAEMDAHGLDPADYDWVPVLRKRRADGWSPQRQRDFIATLADTGSVTEAAKAADMSPQSCYRLRRSPGAENFAAAWDAAVHQASLKLIDIAFDRAINGVADRIEYDAHGDPMEPRRRYNDRLLMFLLRAHQPERYRHASHDVRQAREPAPPPVPSLPEAIARLTPETPPAPHLRAPQGDPVGAMQVAEVIGTGELPHWHRDGPGDFGHGPYPLGIEFERKLATAKRGAGFNP